MTTVERVCRGHPCIECQIVEVLVEAQAFRVVVVVVACQIVDEQLLLLMLRLLLLLLWWWTDWLGFVRIQIGH
jgi:hypothetical protein